MSNVHDVLGASRKVKTLNAQDIKIRSKPKQKPTGLNREIERLGEDAVKLIKELKSDSSSSEDEVTKKLFDKTPITSKWRWTPFVNTARYDGLKLKHWINSVEEETTYIFAKMNKKRDIFYFTDKEWSTIIQPMDIKWTKHQTIQLWQLIEFYSFNFIVVFDRLSEELLKLCPDYDTLRNRYFSVVKELLISRKQNSHILVTKPYNEALERSRRIQLEDELIQSKEIHVEDIQYNKIIDELKSKIRSYETQLRAMRKEAGITKPIISKSIKKLPSIIEEKNEESIQFNGAQCKLLSKKYLEQTIVNRSQFTANELIYNPVHLGPIGARAIFEGLSALKINTTPSFCAYVVASEINCLIDDLIELCALRVEYHNKYFSLNTQQRKHLPNPSNISTLYTTPPLPAATETSIKPVRTSKLSKATPKAKGKKKRKNSEDELATDDD